MSRSIRIEGDPCAHSLRAIVLAALALPLAGQQVRPSTAIESFTGTGQHTLESNGTTTVAVFVESTTQDVYCAVSNDGSLTWSSPQRLDTDTAGVPKTLVEGAVRITNQGVYVAWIEAPASGDDEVFVRRSGDGGFTFEDAAILPSGGSPQGELGTAALSVDSASPYDDVYVAYALDSGGGQHELYLARSDPGQQDAFLAATVVRASTAGDVSGLALDSSKDHVHVAWVDDRNGDEDLWYRRSEDRGATWKQVSDVRVDSGGVSGASVQPDVGLRIGPTEISTGNTGGPVNWISEGGVIGGLGDLVWFVWREDATVLGVPELRSRTSENAGSTLDPVTTIGDYTPGVESVGAYDLALNDVQQSLVIAWEDDRFGPSFVFAAQSDDGTSWSADALLSPLPATGPSVHLHADGTAAAAWVEAGPMDMVGGTYSLDAGQTWKPPVMVSDSSADVSAAAVVYNPACENLIHTWLDERTGTPLLRSGGYVVGSCSCSFPADPGGGCDVRAYAPAIAGAGHPRQRLTVFYPDEDVFSIPDDGWPVILYSPAGAFAEAAPLGTEASSLPAICGEPPSTSSTVSGLGMKFLNDALQSGWAVITVGTIGWNSPPVAGRDPNLFFDQGSPEWNQGNAFWGEQEFTWARQYVAHYANATDPNGCPPLDVDNDRVFVCGTSTGAIYSAFVALGPDRADLSNSDPMLQESTRCAGAILFENPTWFPAYDTSLLGLHWPDAADPLIRAELLSDANPADLEASSISTWLRDPASMAVDTPVFMAFDESVQVADFSRDGSCAVDPAANDPSLEDALNVFVHDSWFALIAAEDLECIDEDFHGAQSRLWVVDALDLGALPATQAELVTGTFAGDVQGDELQDKALDWVLGPKATTNVLNTVGTNTSFNVECYETVSPPVLCGDWRAAVDVSTRPAATLTTVLTFANEAASPLLYQGFAIFVDITEAAIDVSFAAPIGGVGSHVNVVPGDPSLVGVSFTTQAGILGDGLEICNGVELVLGY